MLYNGQTFFDFKIYFEPLYMKLSTLMALVATSSTIEIKQNQNLHLTATNILYDALNMVDNTAKETRASEKKTNDDYVKEIDREINLLNTERVHV